MKKMIKKKRAIKKIKTKIGNQIKLNQTPKDKKKSNNEKDKNNN
jgi:hypothetical protein